MERVTFASSSLTTLNCMADSSSTFDRSLSILASRLSIVGWAGAFGAIIVH